MENWLLIQTFYHGLTNSTRETMDATAGGAFLSLTLLATVYTKIWKEESENSKLLRLYHQGIDQMWIDIGWFWSSVGIGYFIDDVSRRHQWTTYGWRRGKTYQTLQKGKDYGPSYLKLGMFSFTTRIVMSRIWVGFMFWFRVQILDPGHHK